MRVAMVHQGFVPTYRTALFEALNRQPDAEYVVFHGDPPEGTGHRAAPEPYPFPTFRVANRELRFGGTHVIYQPILRELVSGHYDAAVLGPELKFLSTTLAWLALQWLDPAVVLWGHGFDKADDGRGIRRAAARPAGRFKLMMARSSDAYLVYTDGGRVRLMAAGVAAERIHVVNNTLDTEGERRVQRELAPLDEGALRQELGLRDSSVVLLFLGRVYSEKRVDDLVQTVRVIEERQLSRTAIDLVIIGDGPALPSARRAAEGLPAIHFTGELRDPRLVGKYLRVAAAVAIAGKVGLAVNHAFAHGVPVLTRRSALHAPEFEYINHNVNGLVIDGPIERYIEALAGFADSRETQRRLADGALESGERLGVDSMAAAMHAGVCDGIARRDRRPH